MTSWTLTEVAAAVSGRLVGDGNVRVERVTTDSRSTEPGDLFVAVKGDHYDGHDFASDALASGARGIVVETGRPEATPRVEVADTLAALRDLAATRRTRIAVPVVAVTGSTGKTTTKDLLAAALPGSWASPRSYNNEVGVPLTVLGTPSAARHVVVEVGSRGVGHIRWLMPAVRPDVAVITNLGVVHLETFGSTERLAAAKWELVEALTEHGVAVLPAREPRLARSHRGETITFGVDTAADVIASGVTLDEAGRPSLVIDAAGSTVSLKLQIAGRHQAANAAAAMAAGVAVGVSVGDLAAGLEAAQASPWRMQITRGRYTVVNDAYNANPDSVEAALQTVAELPGRHVAVLGLMAELGSVSVAEHARIGAEAARLGYAAVVTVGDEPGIAAAAGSIGRNVEDPEKAAALLAGFLRAGDVVLVKASRAVGLEGLAERLAEEAGP